MNFKDILMNAWNWAINTRLVISKKDELFVNLPIVIPVAALFISWPLVLISAVLTLATSCKVKLDSSKSRTYSENLKRQYNKFQQEAAAQRNEYQAQQAAKKAEQAAQAAQAAQQNTVNGWQQTQPAQPAQPVQQTQPPQSAPYIPQYEQQPFPPKADEIKLTLDPNGQDK